MLSKSTLNVILEILSKGASIMYNHEINYIVLNHIESMIANTELYSIRQKALYLKNVCYSGAYSYGNRAVIDTLVLLTEGLHDYWDNNTKEAYKSFTERLEAYGESLEDTLSMLRAVKETYLNITGSPLLFYGLA